MAQAARGPAGRPQPTVSAEGAQRTPRTAARAASAAADAGSPRGGLGEGMVGWGRAGAPSLHRYLHGGPAVLAPNGTKGHLTAGEPGGFRPNSSFKRQ